MAARNRLRQEVVSGTRTERFGAKRTFSNSYLSLYELCGDDAGTPGDNSIFTVDRIRRSGGLINGDEASNLSGYNFRDYPMPEMTNSGHYSHMSVPGQLSDGTYAAQVAARTQPGRASMVSLEYLSELRDVGSKGYTEFGRRLAKMNKFIDRSRFNKLKKFAKLNLVIQFGILPMLSDLETLVKFTSLVDKRVKEYERLYGPRGLRRTLDLFTGSSVSVNRNVLLSGGPILRGDITKTTTVNVRGHIRWRSIFPIQPTDQEMRSMAAKTLLGYQLDPATIYELMPWSWFIDYFTNLGSIVKATKNMTTLVHDDVRIIEHRKTVASSSNHTTANNGKITFSQMRWEKEDKTRRATLPTLFNAQDVLLTEAQTSILGSLVVLKL